MGKSRSTTLIIAYLMSTQPSLTPTTALALVRQTRPFAEPNSGFMKQLDLYHSMSCPSDLDSRPAYQRWMYQRTVKASTDAGMAPEVGDLRFGDEEGSSVGNAEKGLSPVVSSQQQENITAEQPPLAYRCRRCRNPLATSAYLLPHASPSGQPCAHLHITPLSWMRPELEQGKLEGRLECPNVKCGQSVGRYAWQGMRCSCGEWVVPGMTLGRGRVDEVRERPRASGGGKI